VTKVDLYDIGTSTTLESNKSQSIIPSISLLSPAHTPCSPALALAASRGGSAPACQDAPRRMDASAWAQ